MVISITINNDHWVVTRYWPIVTRVYVTAFTFPWVVNSFPLRRSLVCLFSFIALSFRPPSPRVPSFTPVNYHPILDARHVYLYITAIKRRSVRDRYFFNDSSVRNTKYVILRASICQQYFLAQLLVLHKSNKLVIIHFSHGFNIIKNNNYLKVQFFKHFKRFIWNLKKIDRIIDFCHDFNITKPLFKTLAFKIYILSNLLDL